MPFPFSFVFAVPGTPNPFTPHSPSYRPATPNSPTPGPSSKPKLGMNGKIFGGNRIVKPDLLGSRPSTPSLESPQSTSRKRGWVPSNSEPSVPTTIAATVQTSTTGHLNAPSTRRGKLVRRNMEQQHRDEMEGDLPAPKRRKTLAGSLVSTALSAALIGTAVGLTVYRLWKGKGKETDAPPPYEQGEYVHPPGQEEDKNSGPHYVPQPEPSLPENNNLTPPSARSRRTRHVAGRRSAPRHRKVPARTHPTHTHTSNFSSPPSSAQFGIPPEFNFGEPDAADEEQDPDTSDQMDWIGDRLQQLIEEGKKALGKEIVVMSETKEDEVDDGSGQWEDDGAVASSSSASFRKSRSKRPRNLSLSSQRSDCTSAHTTPRTPQKGRFEPYAGGRSSSAFSSPGNRSRRGSVDSAGSFVPAKEDESAWESAELRESMEKARQAYLQRKHQLS